MNDDENRPVPWKTLGWIVFLTLAHRMLIAVLTNTIATDSVHYLRSAEAWSAGEATAAMKSGLHPLFPWLIAAVRFVARDYVFAGTFVTVVLSSAAVVPLYLLTRRVWNDRVALLAGGLYALHPILALESADIMTVGPFLFFLMSSIAFQHAAWEKGRTIPAVFSGVAAGLAYLTRPEGILIGLVLLGLAAASGVAWFRGRKPGPRPLLSATAFLVILVPMVGLVHHATGTWFITARPTALRVWRKWTGDKRPAPRSERPGTLRGQVAFIGSSTPESLKPVFEAGRAVYPPLLILLVLGFLRRGEGGGGRSTRRLLLGLAVLMPLPSLLVSYLTASQDFSHRYVLPSVLLLLPWMAVGLDLLLERLSRIRGKRKRVAALAGILLLLAFGLLARSIRKHRYDEMSYLQAADWLRRQGARTVISTRDKICWYAGARWVGLPQDVKFTLEQLRTHGARFVLIDERSLRKYDAGFMEKLGKAGLTRVAEFPAEKGGDQIRIFILAAETP